MTLSSAEWHRRFRQQARWTRDLRAYVFKRFGLDKAGLVLEVGCGTGAVLVELPGRRHGLDLDGEHLSLAARHAPGVDLVQGDAHHLPYASGSFDLVLCHFLLLWVADPRRVVVEMARLVRPGGAVLALAEPDYGGRIDYPEPLVRLGALQRQALQDQGAQPDMGRRLPGLLAVAGLKEVEAGVLGGRWSGMPDPDEMAQEWRVLRSDLQGLLSPQELDALQAQDEASWARGERLLYVPTFYAFGRM